MKASNMTPTLDCPRYMRPLCEDDYPLHGGWFGVIVAHETMYLTNRPPCLTRADLHKLAHRELSKLRHNMRDKHKFAYAIRVKLKGA